MRGNRHNSSAFNKKTSMVSSISTWSKPSVLTTYGVFLVHPSISKHAITVSPQTKQARLTTSTHEGLTWLTLGASKEECFDVASHTNAEMSARSWKGRIRAQILSVYLIKIVYGYYARNLLATIDLEIDSSDMQSHNLCPHQIIDRGKDMYLKIIKLAGRLDRLSSSSLAVSTF